MCAATTVLPKVLAEIAARFERNYVVVAYEVTDVLAEIAARFERNMVLRRVRMVRVLAEIAARFERNFGDMARSYEMF